MSAPAVTALLAQASADGSLGGGEATLFWILAPLIVIAALGLLFAKKAVHAAMAVAFVMISLAVVYAAQGAQFLFAAQIVVYTGAVMMLFLFVLMLVGVDSADSLVETIKGQRLIAALAGLGALVFLISTVAGVYRGWFGIEGVTLPSPAGLEAANAEGNPQGIAKLLFSDYVIAFELTGALLITAALGAIVLTHRERLVDRVSQRTLSQRRIRENVAVAGLPAPGVFARHNSVETPALLPDGTPSEESVSRVLKVRGQVRSSAGLDTAVREIAGEMGVEVPERTDRGLTGTQGPDDLLADATGRPVEPAAAEAAASVDAVEAAPQDPDATTPQEGDDR